MRARLDFLEKGSARSSPQTAAAPSGGTPDFGDDERLVSEYLGRVLSEMGVPPIPYHALTRTKLYPRFQVKSQYLLGFVDTNMRPKTRVERAKAVYIALRALAVRVRQIGKAPLSLQAVVDRMTHIADDIDQQFPGYLASNLLPIVISQCSAA